jgi:hypothetical protein
VRYHAQPSGAQDHAVYAAAVQVADIMVREIGISGGFELVPAPAAGAGHRSDAWRILFGTNEREEALAKAALANALSQLPTMLSGLV